MPAISVPSSSPKQMDALFLGIWTDCTHGMKRAKLLIVIMHAQAEAPKLPASCAKPIPQRSNNRSKLSPNNSPKESNGEPIESNRSSIATL
jgi:hypothetical protein